MSAYKLSNDFQVSLHEAEKFIENFYEAYPLLKSYFQKVQSEALSTGIIRISKFTNHKVHCFPYFNKMQENLKVIQAYKNSPKGVAKKVWKEYFTSKGQIERISQNYPIQGCGALMTKIAVILFNRSIKANNLDASVVNLVHDEIVVETTKEHAKQVKQLLIHSMKQSGSYLIKSLPIEVEAKITEFWDH